MAKVIYVPKWVLPFAYGLTLLPWVVLVRKDSEDLEYVKQHELVHIEQWKRIGYFKFPFIYWYYTFKYGYKLNPFEVQARALGARRSRK